MEGIDTFNTTIVEVIKIIKQLHIDLKQHYQNDGAKRDEYLLNKTNLESEAGDEEKAIAIWNLKRAKCCNQYYCNFTFHRGTGIMSQEINRI